MREGYKDSALGEIPEDWEVGAINDYVEAIKGGAALKPSDFVEGKGFPVIPKKAIGSGGKLNIDKLNPTFCTFSFAKANDTNIIDETYIVTTLRDLVPSGPSIGYMVEFHSKEEYILAQGVYGFQLNDKINRKFVVQYSNTKEFRKVMQKIKVGSTQVHIRNKDYFGVTIPLPPLPEQQKIAQILSTVDEKIDIIDQQIAERTELKKGLMQKLLTKGIGHSKFKDSPLGKIPEDWNVVKISDLKKQGVFSMIQDGNHGESHPVSSDFVKEGVPFIMANSITKSNVIDLSSVKRISEKQYKSLRIGFAEPNDVLLTHKGTVGLTALVEECHGSLMLTPQVTLYRIAHSTQLNRKYLYYYFQSDCFQKVIEKYSKQSTRAYIGITNQQKLSVILPQNITEQKQIASILSTVDEKLNVLKDKKSEYQELKKGLMQQLLTGKVRVKVEERVAQ